MTSDLNKRSDFHIRNSRSPTNPLSREHQLLENGAFEYARDRYAFKGLVCVHLHFCTPVGAAFIIDYAATTEICNSQKLRLKTCLHWGITFYLDFVKTLARLMFFVMTASLQASILP